VFTSARFARALGLSSAPLPFLLLLQHAVSMSHVDSSRDILDVGYTSKSSSHTISSQPRMNALTIVPNTPPSPDAVYRSALYAGATVRKEYTVKAVRRAHSHGASDAPGQPARGSAPSGWAALVVVRCELIDADTGAVAFSVDKAMLVPGVQPKHPDNGARAPAPAATVGVTPGPGSERLPAGPAPASRFLQQVLAGSAGLQFAQSRRLFPRYAANIDTHDIHHRH
jgi:hypothetical protein